MFKPEYPIPALFTQGCLTCGNKNYTVEYHGERHVCHKCKVYLQTPEGKPIELISTPDHRIFAFVKQLKEGGDRKIQYVEVSYNDMRIFDKKCYATYAGEGELVVLLREFDEK